MIAYKLVRKMKEGYSPLFINKRLRMHKGFMYQAENHTTKGFAERFGWHCTLRPVAPHLKEDKDNRVWVKVRLVGDIVTYARPESQGGTWVLCRGLLQILEEV